MKTSAFHAHPFARTEIMENFQLGYETWLAWSTRECTLYPSYDERPVDRLQAEGALGPDAFDHDRNRLVTTVRGVLLRMLAQHGSIWWADSASILPTTYRAMAELVCARQAVDANDERGGLRLIVRPAGLEAAAKLPRDTN